MNKLDIRLKIKKFIMEDKIRTAKIIVICLIIFAGIGSYMMSKGGEKEEYDIQDNKDFQKEKNERYAEKTSDTIVVDVSGAVNDPNIVELKGKARVYEAIKGAGGLAKNADISNINRAAFCKDGDKIYIPVKGEHPKNNKIQTGLGSINTSGQIDLNAASQSDLETLTGIGPVISQRIIDYREEKGGFYSIEDLKSVKGIGEKTFEKIKEDVTV